MKIQYDKYVKVYDKYTFGYKWMKVNENERQLFFGKSGKGFCVGVTYNKKEKMAFKDNSGYFKSCNEENNLPQGKEGTYKMIYAAVHMILYRYPDARLLSWKDNTMITLKDGDVSLSDSDTILYGRPRVIDLVGEHSVKDRLYLQLSILILGQLKKEKQHTFERFWRKYYYDYNNFHKDEIRELSKIYDTSPTLLLFFQKADEFLSRVGKKKWIFLPLRIIFMDNDILSYVGRTWVLDIQTAIEHANVKVERVIGQMGGGKNFDKFNIKLPETRIHHIDGPSGDRLHINSSYYYLDTLRKLM